jgi:TRAP-type C4-dicarboxylate transport system permease small subunit
MLDNKNTIVRKAGKILAIISGAALLVIMVVTVTNVIMRLLHNTLIGAFEFTTLMIIVTASLAVGYTAAEKGHIDIDALTCKLPERAQRILKIIMYIISLGFVGFLSFATAWMISVKLQITETTDLLGIPYQPFRFIVLFGLLFLFAATLVYLVQLIRSGETK